VHIRLYNADGAQYGVGMPVVAIFSRKITDARAFARATKVTVNGRPTEAAWYFPDQPALGPMEAHLRPERYWPADSQVRVSLATAGLPAGDGLRFDDSLTLGFSTGPAVVATVDDRRHELVLRTDGKQVGTFKVSLGKKQTPTERGTKVILRQQPSICITDHQTYKQCGVKYAQQVTFDGEYLLAAPWNERLIQKGVDSSNGCTHLMPQDAAFLYRTLRVGDVVRYVDVKGPPATMSTAFADWDVPWPTWVKGGALPTR
jgi:lipoprotein-anchoring transpeptidase ErfK/SrfK